jgi:hypothetical protein
MKAVAERCCAICLEPRLGGDGWFLLIENRWTDRLKILGWNDGLASEPGVYTACGAEHVQQLVIHWMAMGTLDYPFARAHREAKRSLRRPSEKPATPEPDTRGIRIFGELAVHRESLERVLSENPQSLASILLALISALGGQHNALPAEEMEEEAALVLT